MGYWYGNTDDRADSWHWIGIAVSLSQTIGLHRNPARSNVPESQRRLWKRLWWCCFYRDRFIALGMGRPMRIHLSDCDLEILTADDLIEPTLPFGLSESRRALVERCNSLAPLFVQVAKLSIHLGDALECQYSAVQPRSTPEMVQNCEMSLAKWYDELEPSLKIDFSSLPSDEPRVLSVHKHILHIFFR